MAHLLVRNLDARLVRRLKAQAKGHGRSLVAEVREILAREAAAVSMADARATALRIRRLFAGRRFSDSAALIAEDRAR